MKTTTKKATSLLLVLLALISFNEIEAQECPNNWIHNDFEFQLSGDKYEKTIQNFNNHEISLMIKNSEVTIPAKGKITLGFEPKWEDVKCTSIKIDGYSITNFQKVYAFLGAYNNQRLLSSSNDKSYLNNFITERNKLIDEIKVLQSNVPDWYKTRLDFCIQQSELLISTAKKENKINIITNKNVK